MRSVARRVGHAEEKEKKEAKAIRPRVWELKKNRELKHREFGHFCVSSRVSK